MCRATWTDGRARKDLPIDGRLDEILAAHLSNQVVVLESPTGTGKTVRVPQKIVLHDPTAKVWATEPTRVAVTWSGAYICEEMGVEAGGLVGWSVRGDKRVSRRHTRLKLTVDQTLVNWIVKNNGELPEGTLFLDEAHLQHVPQALLFGQVKEALARSPRTRVIVSSATMNGAKLSEYFGNAPRITLETKRYPVEVRPYRLRHGEHHSEGAVSAATEVLDQFLAGTLQVPTLDGKGLTFCAGGTIAVLLPGKEDIRRVMSDITKYAQRKGASAQVELVECHAEVNDLNRLHAPVEPGNLRFVVATEILRNAITIPSLIGVIDSLQVKRMMIDHNGVSHLTKVAISEAEAQQAMGRVGRVGTGFYIPVSFGSEFETLQKFPTPPIQCSPLGSVVLSVNAIGQNVRTFPFLDAPHLEHLDVTIRRLQRIGALDKDEKITDMGRDLNRFPIDPERAYMLLKAKDLGVLPEAAIVAAVMENGDPFETPRPGPMTTRLSVGDRTARLLMANAQLTRENDGRTPESDKLLPPADDRDSIYFNEDWLYQDAGEWIVDPSSYGFPTKFGMSWIASVLRRHFAGKEGSDFACLVRIVRAYQQQYEVVERRYARAPRREQKIRQEMEGWCRSIFINQKRLLRCMDTLDQILEELSACGLASDHPVFETRDFDVNALTKAFLVGAIDNVSVGGFRRDYRGPLGHFQLAWSSACPAAEVVVIGGVRKVGDGGHTLLANSAARVQPEWLIEMLPQLCQLTPEAEGAHYEAHTDTVKVTRQLSFCDNFIGALSCAVEDRTVATNTLAAALADEQWWGANCPWTVSEVLDDNRRKLLNVRRLWGRAKPGTFPISSRAELVAHYVKALQGATRLTHIANPLLLAIPEHDTSIEEKLLAEFPDEIWVNWMSFPVTYAIVDGEVTASIDLALDGYRQTWMSLPRPHVKLPNGLPVRVRFTSDRGAQVSGVDTAVLQEDIRQLLNQEQLSSSWSLPFLPSLRLDHAREVLPAIVEAKFGTDALTKSPFTVYGVLEWCEPHLGRPMARWFVKRTEAEAMHEASSLGLARYQRSRFGFAHRALPDDEQAPPSSFQNLAALLGQLGEKFTVLPTRRKPGQ